MGSSQCPLAVLQSKMQKKHNQTLDIHQNLTSLLPYQTQQHSSPCRRKSNKEARLNNQTAKPLAGVGLFIKRAAGDRVSAVAK